MERYYSIRRVKVKTKIIITIILIVIFIIFVTIIIIQFFLYTVKSSVNCKDSNVLCYAKLKFKNTIYNVTVYLQ